MFAPQPREISNLFLVYGSAILSFLFFSLLLASMGFLFRIPILSCYFSLAFLFTSAFVLLSCSVFPYPGKLFDTLIVLTLFLFSFYLSLEISRSFFDISYDGQAYHQEALIQLSRSWNPFFWNAGAVGRPITCTPG